MFQYVQKAAKGIHSISKKVHCRVPAQASNVHLSLHEQKHTAQPTGLGVILWPVLIGLAIDGLPAEPFRGALETVPGTKLLPSSPQSLQPIVQNGLAVQRRKLIPDCSCSAVAKPTQPSTSQSRLSKRKRLQCFRQPDVLLRVAFCEEAVACPSDLATETALPAYS